MLNTTNGKRAATLMTLLASLLIAASANAQTTDKAASKVAAKPVVKATTVDDGVVRYPPSSVRLPLILGGLGVTGTAYGLSVMSARVWQDVPGSDMLLIPFAGPWIALAKNDCAADSPDCGTILTIRGALYVLDGLAQLAGLGLIGEGMFMTTEAADPDKTDADEKKKTPKTSWMLTPQVGPTRAGLSLVGTF